MLNKDVSRAGREGVSYRPPRPGGEGRPKDFVYYTILYYTILYYTILYSTLLYSTILEEGL